MKTSDEACWLKEVDSIALQSSVKNLADAFTRFFNKQNNYPQFKSKRHPVQSYLTKNVHNSIEVKGKYLKIPKLGVMKFAKSREPKGRIINATIRKNASGKFFVSILCKEEIPELPETKSAIGIDLGITDFAILSDGSKVRSEEHTSELQSRGHLVCSLL